MDHPVGETEAGGYSSMFVEEGPYSSGRRREEGQWIIHWRKDVPVGFGQRLLEMWDFHLCGRHREKSLPARVHRRFPVGPGLPAALKKPIINGNPLNHTRAFPGVQEGSRDNDRNLEKAVGWHTGCAIVLFFCRRGTFGGVKSSSEAARVSQLIMADRYKTFFSLFQLYNNNFTIIIKLLLLIIETHAR